MLHIVMDHTPKALPGPACVLLHHLLHQCCEFRLPSTLSVEHIANVAQSGRNIVDLS